MKVRYSEQVEKFLMNHEAGNALVKTIILNADELMKGKEFEVVIPNDQSIEVKISSKSATTENSIVR